MAVRTTMDGLPTELFDLILDQCEVADLKNIRLINRKYYEILTPRLFEHFYVGIFNDSLDRLISIAKSEHAKHIKRITVYIDRLPEWDRQQWEAAINYKPDIKYWRTHGQQQDDSTPLWKRYIGDVPDELPFELPDHISNAPSTTSHHYFSPQQLDTGWQSFDSICRQQAEWHWNGAGVALKECFAMLPNLNEVTCKPAYITREDRPRNWPVWKRLRRCIYVVPVEWTSSTAGDGLENVADCGDFSVGATLLILDAIAFRCSFSGTKPISKLKLHNRQDFEVGPYMAELVTGARNSAIAEVFMYLEHLDWCVSVTPSLDPDLRPDGGNTETVPFLLKARQVQSLRLSFYDCKYAPQARYLVPPGEAIIDMILSAKSPWPQLRSVSLNFRANARKLLELFKFLSTTLISLELTYMEVGDARDLIARIPKLLRLEKVQLKSIWHVHETGAIECLFPNGLSVDAPLERAVRNYLLGLSWGCPNLGLHFE